LAINIIICCNLLIAQRPWLSNHSPRLPCVLSIRYRVELNQFEREQLNTLLSVDRHSTRRLKRTQILLAASDRIRRALHAGHSRARCADGRDVHGPGTAPPWLAAIPTSVPQSASLVAGPRSRSPRRRPRRFSAASRKAGHIVARGKGTSARELIIAAATRG